MPTPRLRSTVESVRSLCHLLMGSLADRCSMRALAMPKLPSEFSKSMGFTCGTQTEGLPHALCFSMASTRLPCEWAMDGHGAA